jgi:hypothetical protein
VKKGPPGGDKSYIRCNWQVFYFSKMILTSKKHLGEIALGVFILKFLSSKRKSPQ